MVADTIPPPTAPYFAAVDRATAKYPFDPRRTEQILGELGYAKGSDGIYTSPSDGRFQMEVRGVSGGDESIRLPGGLQLGSGRGRVLAGH